MYDEKIIQPFNHALLTDEANPRRSSKQNIQNPLQLEKEWKQMSVVGLNLGLWVSSPWSTPV
jgi:hypothetical protein